LKKLYHRVAIFFGLPLLGVLAALPFYRNTDSIPNPLPVADQAPPPPPTGWSLDERGSSPLVTAMTVPSLDIPSGPPSVSIPPRYEDAAIPVRGPTQKRDAADHSSRDPSASAQDFAMDSPGGWRSHQFGTGQPVHPGPLVAPNQTPGPRTQRELVPSLSTLPAPQPGNGQLVVREPGTSSETSGPDQGPRNPWQLTVGRRAVDGTEPPRSIERETIVAEPIPAPPLAGPLDLPQNTPPVPQGQWAAPTTVPTFNRPPSESPRPRHVIREPGMR
jgi:hypothetical protein